MSHRDSSLRMVFSKLLSVYPEETNLCAVKTPHIISEKKMMTGRKYK